MMSWIPLAWWAAGTVGFLFAAWQSEHEIQVRDLLLGVFLGFAGPMWLVIAIGIWLYQNSHRVIIKRRKN